MVDASFLYHYKFEINLFFYNFILIVYLFILYIYPLLTVGADRSTLFMSTNNRENVKIEVFCLYIDIIYIRTYMKRSRSTISRRKKIIEFYK